MWEMPVDQYNRLSEKLDDIGRHTADLRTEAALMREKLCNVNDHLAKINGRVGTSEKNITALTDIVTELKGAWKLLVGIASAISAGIAWLFQHLQVPHK